MPQGFDAFTGYRQVVKVVVGTGDAVALTKQSISVDSILGWDEANQRL
jgi:hypothetical protein